MITPLPAGTSFAGYQLDAVVARGGMGVIYLATQVRPRRRVALKLIAPHLAADPAYRERFLREVDALAVLEHPNVVPIYAAGEWEGQLFLAMRYLDGPDLAEMIRTSAPLDPRTVVGMLGPIAAALDEAHRRGIVHRDVTPGNIRLDGRGIPYLTDFGLTKRAASRGELTQALGPLGTPSYMAPEQFAGAGPAAPAESAPSTEGSPAPSDPALAGRIDIYALGCVLVAALTGEPPYPRETYEAALWAHVHEPPPSLVERRADLPAALDGIVARAMAKDPAARYPTATELMLAVRAEVLGHGAALPGRPAGAAADEPRAGSTLTRVAPPTRGVVEQAPRRLRGLAGALGVVGLVVAAGALGLVLGLLAVGAAGPRASATASQVAAASTTGVTPRPTRAPTPTPPPPPTPTPTPAPTPTPTPAPTPRLGDSADVARLRNAVPAGLRDSCTSVGLASSSERAAYDCQATGVAAVRYTLYASRNGMNAAFDRLMPTQKFSSDPQTCAAGKPAKGPWGSSGFLGLGSSTLGRMACWTDSNQHARIAWTLDGGPILARTYRNDNDLAALYDVWAGGRLHPAAP